jgi:hypothetical protein
MEKERSDLQSPRTITNNYNNMEYYSLSPTPNPNPTPPNQIQKKLTGIQQQSKEVQDLMKNNIQKAIERGNNLEHLESQTDKFNNRANRFYNAAKKLKCFLIKKNIRNIIIFLAFLIVFILLVIWLTGGFGSF